MTSAENAENAVNAENTDTSSHEAGGQVADGQVASGQGDGIGGLEPDVQVDEWPWPLSAFLQAIGLRPVHMSGSRVVGWADLGPDHHAPQGVVHGGVYAALVETAGSIGATAAVADRGQYAVGVHNATDFLRSHVAGRVTVTAEPVQQGRVQQLWDVRIERDEDGALLARGQLRLQNITRR